MNWALNQTIKKPIEKLILVVLARHRNEENGLCNPSQNTIARMVGCSRSTVQENLPALEKNGFIKITAGNRTTSASYDLLIKVAREPVNPSPRAGQGVAREPVTNNINSINIDNDLGPRAGQPLTESRSTLWEPDQVTIDTCRMHGVKITDDVIASFRLKIADWQDLGYTPKIRSQFLSHARSIQNGIYKTESTIEDRLSSTDWAN